MGMVCEAQLQLQSERLVQPQELLVRRPVRPTAAPNWGVYKRSKITCA